MQPTEDKGSHQNGVLKEALKKEIEKEYGHSFKDSRLRSQTPNFGKTGFQTKRLLTMLQSSDGSGCCVENRRLLLNTKNSLHMVDGPENRYYLGIIDFFTKYEAKQKFWAFWKSIFNCSTEHSTVPPDVYSRRFINFIKDHTR